MRPHLISRAPNSSKENLSLQQILLSSMIFVAIQTKPGWSVTTDANPRAFLGSPLPKSSQSPSMGCPFGELSVFAINGFNFVPFLFMSRESKKVGRNFRKRKKGPRCRGWKRKGSTTRTSSGDASGEYTHFRGGSGLWEVVAAAFLQSVFSGSVGPLVGAIRFRLLLKPLNLSILSCGMSLPMEYFLLTHLFVYLLLCEQKHTIYWCLNNPVIEVYASSPPTSRKGAELTVVVASSKSLPNLSGVGATPMVDLSVLWKSLRSMEFRVFSGFLYTRLSSINYLFLVYIHVDAYLGFLLISLLKIILCIPGLAGNRIEYDVEQTIDYPVNLLVKITIRVLNGFFKYGFTDLSFTAIVAPHVPFMGYESEDLGVSDPVIPAPGNCKDDFHLVYITSSQLKGYCKKTSSSEPVCSLNKFICVLHVLYYWFLLLTNVWCAKLSQNLVLCLYEFCISCVVPTRLLWTAFDPLSG